MNLEDGGRRIHPQNRADNCCAASTGKTFDREGKDCRDYRGPTKTHGGSSFCDIGLPSDARTALCCGCVGFVGSTPAIEAIQPAMSLGGGFAF
jgi:hypothetical protein